MTKEIKSEWLKISDLHVKIDDKEIISGVGVTLAVGQVKVLLGPNGAGKSTLGRVIAGWPHLQVSSGEISWLGQDLLSLEMYERARAGVMLIWQEPVSIPGVTISNFLRQASEKITGKKESIFAWQTKLNKFCEQLQLSPTILSRDLGMGFSGGEKKKIELLQMLALEPKLVILDELDSGLDADAIKVARECLSMYQQSHETAFLVITHTAQILADLPIDEVMIMNQGSIVARGGKELVERVRHDGYHWLREGKDERSDA